LTTERFAPAAPLADLAEGKMLSCDIEGRNVVLCRTKDGIFALDNICSHAYAQMHEGRLRGVRLICPLHGASFDVRDGRVLGAPASRPLCTHATRVVDGKIEVALNPAAPAQPTIG
jgi:3-phenylpropionate/trans-cinnamate dioxygenase ferredoxin subunit